MLRPVHVFLPNSVLPELGNGFELQLRNGSCNHSTPAVSSRK